MTAPEMTVPEQQSIISEMSRIADIFVNSEGEIRPHFFLTGPSGSGKTYTVQNLAARYGVAYHEINAAQLTKEGTSGNSLSKALAPIRNKSAGLCICFVDEFDKLFISGNNNTDLAHEVTHGVQNEFLKVLESKTTSVFGDYGKYDEVKINHVLFIFAGAFNGEDNITLDRLREFGIKTEFLGRVGLIYNLPKLSLNSLYETLKNSSLLRQYLALFPDVNEKQVIHDVMEAVSRNYDKNTLGIRLLNTLLHQYFILGGFPQEAKQVDKLAFQKTLSFQANPNGQITD